MQKWGHGSTSFRRFCSFVTRDPVARSTTFARGTSFRLGERGHSQRDRRAGCGLFVYSWSARTLMSIARHVCDVVMVGQSDNRNKKMALIDLRVIYRLGAELPETRVVTATPVRRAVDSRNRLTKIRPNTLQQMSTLWSEEDMDGLEIPTSVSRTRSKERRKTI